MSRIGKQIIAVPTGVNVTLTDGKVGVQGPKGKLELVLHPHITVVKEDDGLHVHVSDETVKKNRALWGLFGALVKNLVLGVTAGYEKKLEVNGIGFRVAVAGSALKLELGFSHPVEFKLPAGVAAVIEKNIITLSGVDKQLVGETAARIRHLRPPEPYKGKGIKYLDEVIRRKAGKAAKSAGAA
ncbi:MAG: rplF [Candidatus Magasanikbacteria bacterium]|nr:rplF [Candidatus Magasanikbacteria bacterium]